MCRNVGRTVVQNGYIWEYSPGNPQENLWGYAFQHRLVAEWCLGRFLSAEEVVHHENEKKDDNRPENLRVFATAGDHIHFHQRSACLNDQEIVARIHEMCESYPGTQKQAAKELGLSLLTFRKVIEDYRLPWRNRLAARIDEASVREALVGRSTLEAAKHLGVSHSTLRLRYPQLLRKRASPLSLESRKEEIRSLATRMKVAEIARQLQIPCAETVRGAIYRWAAEEPDAWSSAAAFQRTRLGLSRRKPRKASSQ